MANNNKQPLIASIVVAVLLLGVSGDGGGGNPAAILEAAVAGEDGPLSCMGKLRPCEKFFANTSSEPPEECCKTMNEVVEKEKPCLCSLFQNEQLLRSVNMTQENALGIAKKCGSEADLSCKNVALPPGLASAANSSTSNGGSPSESGANNERKLASPIGVFLALLSFMGLMA